jgi:serine phosphatase RsbU (regulator of sigma subunit)
MKSNLNFYNLILQIGTDQNTPERKALKIKIVNGIAAIFSLVMLVTTLLVLYLASRDPEFSIPETLRLINTGSIDSLIKYHQHEVFIFFDFVSVVFCVLVLVLNYLRKYNAAALLLCVFATSLTLLYYWMRGITIIYFFFIPVMLSVVLYERRRQYVAFIIISIGLMILLTILKFDNGRGDLFAMPLNNTTSLLMFFVNIIITLLLIISIIFYFKSENTKSEIHLFQKNALLESQQIQIIAQRDEIIEQKREIEIKNKNITDSINYAKNIQTALLPRHELLDAILPEHFILLKPRDIVSGDFYWFSYIENLSVFAAVDCTGHGVPGAFMSMLGSAFLNEIVNKEYITHPGVILRRLRKEIIRSLHQSGEFGEAKDGMDLVVCTIDYSCMKLQFSGANNPMYMIRKKDGRPRLPFPVTENEEYILFDVKGDRMPASVHIDMHNFNVHEIDFIKGDIIYMFSDGYADQFGGPDEKKFGYLNFRKLLLSVCNESLEAQQEILDRQIEEWKGEMNQIDDIMVIAIRL